MRERRIYAQQTQYEDFLEFILRRGHLTQIALHAPHYDETILRFCRGQATSLDIAATLRSSAYFSHSTAAYLNGLTNTLPTPPLPLSPSSPLPQLGVESIAASSGRSFSTTNLERTLVDLTVRPAYAGGIVAALECFRVAKARISMKKLLQILDQLDYLYPYAQAIGFLAQRAGFSEADLHRLKDRISSLKFYLVHGMKNPALDETWRIYHPTDL